MRRVRTPQTISNQSLLIIIFILLLHNFYSPAGVLVPKSDGVPAAAGLAPPNRLLAPPVFPNKDILYSNGCFYGY